ncbi:MAG TPA: hypothetical protein VJK51_04505 [Candidatus Nanoarchaeia archaeon]|nr:hypothetical protein [Candidatus Nanoarchaeia archaeon]
MPKLKKIQTQEELQSELEGKIIAFARKKDIIEAAYRDVDPEEGHRVYWLTHQPPYNVSLGNSITRFEIELFKKYTPRIPYFDIATCQPQDNMLVSLGEKIWERK